MNARITVDLASGVPPYEQVRGQVAALVAAGALAAGERLPTVRELANDLGVAAGTVQRAYRELEAGGVVVSRRRIGTVVAPAVDGTQPRDLLLDRARDLVRAARAHGLQDAEVLDLLRGIMLAEDGPNVPGGPGS